MNAADLRERLERIVKVGRNGLARGKERRELNSTDGDGGYAYEAGALQGTVEWMVEKLLELQKDASPRGGK